LISSGALGLPFYVPVDSTFAVAERIVLSAANDRELKAFVGVLVGAVDNAETVA
jgi:hypothetical protein